MIVTKIKASAKVVAYATIMVSTVVFWAIFYYLFSEFGLDPEAAMSTATILSFLFPVVFFINWPSPIRPYPWEKEYFNE